MNESELIKKHFKLQYPDQDIRVDYGGTILKLEDISGGDGNVVNGSVYINVYPIVNGKKIESELKDVQISIEELENITLPTEFLFDIAD
jgi:hypothetical protein